MLCLILKPTGEGVMLTGILWWVLRGGAVALDAATRGLKTAMVEADDFSAGWVTHAHTALLSHVVGGFVGSPTCLWVIDGRWLAGWLRACLTVWLAACLPVRLAGWLPAFLLACLLAVACCSTSGRSTKLIHGGIRYLETAFKKLDYGSYELVKVTHQTP